MWGLVLGLYLLIGLVLWSEACSDKLNDFWENLVWVIVCVLWPVVLVAVMVYGCWEKLSEWIRDNRE